MCTYTQMPYAVTSNVRQKKNVSETWHRTQKELQTETTTKPETFQDWSSPDFRLLGLVGWLFCLFVCFLKKEQNHHYGIILSFAGKYYIKRERKHKDIRLPFPFCIKKWPQHMSRLILQVAWEDMLPKTINKLDSLKFNIILKRN